MLDGLCCIYEDGCAGVMRHPDDLPGRVNGAERVGNVIEGDEASLVT